MATYQDLPRTQRVPDYLEADSRSLAIIVALTDRALAARAAVEDASDQAHIATATWGLALWEDLVGIVPADGASYEDRRTAITTKLLGSGTCNAGMISDIAKALTGYEAVVVEQADEYTFSLYFVGDSSFFASFDLDAIIAAVEEVKPAHLKFVILPVTWGDLQTAGLTWAQLEEQFPTWQSFDEKIMVRARESTS